MARWDRECHFGDSGSLACPMAKVTNELGKGAKPDKWSSEDRNPTGCRVVDPAVYDLCTAFLAACYTTKSQQLVENCTSPLPPTFTKLGLPEGAPSLPVDLRWFRPSVYRKTGWVGADQRSGIISPGDGWRLATPRRDECQCSCERDQ